MVREGILEVLSAIMAVLEEKQIIGWFVSVMLVWAVFISFV